MVDFLFLFLFALSPHHTGLEDEVFVGFPFTYKETEVCKATF